MTALQVPTRRVFEFRPNVRRKSGRKWIHFECAASSWHAGKFHDPVFVPCADLEGVVCVLCGKEIIK